MFEAIHGSAPDISGKGIANPSGLINGAIMMLVHLNKTDIATKLENAWLKTIEDGIHTGDIYKEGVSTKRVGTAEFSDAVIARMGELPTKFKPASYVKREGDIKKIKISPTIPAEKTLVGVDVFVDWGTTNPTLVCETIEKLATDKLKLKMITNRGLKVYPNPMPASYCVDHWRCRYYATEGTATGADVAKLLMLLSDAKIDFIKTEHLYNFDGERGYTLAQGE